jgi:hypothetical protein
MTQADRITVLYILIFTSDRICGQKTEGSEPESCKHFTGIISLLFFLEIILKTASVV